MIMRCVLRTFTIYRFSAFAIPVFAVGGCPRISNQTMMTFVHACAKSNNCNGREPHSVNLGLREVVWCHTLLKRTALVCFCYDVHDCGGPLERCLRLYILTHVVFCIYVVQRRSGGMVLLLVWMAAVEFMIPMGVTQKKFVFFFGFALGGLRGIVHVFFFLTGRRMLGKISKGGWGGGIPCVLSSGIVARAGFSRCYQIARNA